MSVEEDEVEDPEFVEALQNDRRRYFPIRGGWIRVTQPHKIFCPNGKPIFYVNFAVRYEGGVIEFQLYRNTGRSVHAICDSKVLRRLCPKRGIRARKSTGKIRNEILKDRREEK